MKLSEACKLIVDCPHTSAKDEGKGIALIRTPNVGKGRLILDNVHRVSEKVYEERIARATPSPGDLILAREAPVGNVAIIQEGQKVCLGQRVVLLRANEEIVLPDYLVYYLLSRPVQHRLLNQTNETTVAHLNVAAIRNLDIDLPSLSTQRRISSILSSLDRKIELNNKINESLEEMAQALFKSWFVDFEPFKNGKFINSELGMLPEGWRVGTLNDVCDFSSGYSYKGTELQPSCDAMATIKNFDRKGGFKTNGYKDIIISSKVKPTQYVNLFDILIAHTDLTQNAEIVGNPAIVLDKGGYKNIIMSMDLVKATPKNQELSYGLLYSILKSRAFKQHALGYVNGTTVLHMSKKALPEYVFALPQDLSSVKGLSSSLDEIFRMIAVNIQESSNLTHLRDSLLPRLMSGEIDIK